MIEFANGPIVWQSQKQKIVAQSTTEAEYIAAVQCCRHMKFTLSVIQELLKDKIDVVLYADNQSCINMIKSGQLTRKSVFIDVKYHFIRDEMKKGWFKIKYCPSEKNQVDILTKPLKPVAFQRLKSETVKC